MASTEQESTGQRSAQASVNSSAVSTPGVGTKDTSQGEKTSDDNAGNYDAIRQGKQKAQEAMTAAGLAVDVAPLADTEETVNGDAQLSRKRSRDGTQLPVNTTQGSANGSSIDTAEHDEITLDRYIQRDLMHGWIGTVQDRRHKDVFEQKRREKEYYGTLRAQNRPAAIFGYGYAGYGNGTTDVQGGPPRIIYSALRPPPKGRRCPQLRIPRKDNQQQAEQMEQLVPIRLDIELDKLRLRDTFTWNLQEKLISPAMFTDYLLEDLRIPPEAASEVARQVRQEIEEQTHNYYPHIVVGDGPLEAGRPYTDYKDDEMRIQIKLHITIGRITLVDQFEWDINDPHNSPEEFARQMAWENALSGEFTTAIAHSIREQSHQYTKSLWLTNHVFDGRLVEDAEVRDAFLPAPIHSSFRPQQSQKDWTPYMYEMSEAELDRTETVMMREHRAQKRQLNRRGGPALPDLKERQRTVRSLFVHSVIPGAVETWETTGIPKTRRTGGRGRRPGARGADEDVDSSDLESEDETPESPLPSANMSAIAGTARTRNMRGAASAAQAAMRAGYGRSLTPDSQVPTPQDTRVSARRSMLREESVNDDPDRLLVRLRISKTRFRTWWDEYRAKKRASEFPLSGYASAPAVVARPPAATPKKESAIGTPAPTPRNARDSRTPTANGSQRGGSRNVQYDSQGRVETDHWPDVDDRPPIPPSWLQAGIKNMRAQYPESDFEALMRPYCFNTANDNVHRPNPPLQPGATAPEGTRIMYAPRIRCNDCPGKVYNTIPGKVEEGFEVHLRNRVHKERVAERIGQ